MTTIKQLNQAIGYGWQPNAECAARRAASKIGAEYLGGCLVRTDEAVACVKGNRKHTIFYAIEADCIERQD